MIPTWKIVGEHEAYGKVFEYSIEIFADIAELFIELWINKTAMGLCADWEKR